MTMSLSSWDGSLLEGGILGGTEINGCDLSSIPRDDVGVI
jgi:hypothetical protein